MFVILLVIICNPFILELIFLSFLRLHPASVIVPFFIYLFIYLTELLILTALMFYVPALDDTCYCNHFVSFCESAAQS